jgi:hypothetical protein
MHSLTGAGAAPCRVVLFGATRRPGQYLPIDGCEQPASEVAGPTPMPTACDYSGDGLGVAVLTADFGRGARRRRLFEPESSAP